jgi:antitoxin component YwqK of YwqJK toxin-antitoxin module
MRAILLLSLALLPAAVSLTQEKEPAKPAESGGVPFKNLGWDSAKSLFTYPFTGVATEQYKNGQMKLRYHIREGKYDGLVEEWYENGSPKTKTSYENGKHQGDNFYWNPDGSLQAHKIWKDDVLITEHAEKKP